MSTEEEILELKRRLDILEREKGERKKWIRGELSHIRYIVNLHNNYIERAARDINNATITLQDILREIYAGERNV